MRTIAIVVSTAVLAGASSLVAQGAQSPVDEQNIRVVLLGTQGGPTFNAQRLGISTLVLAGSERLLFDAGRGTTTGMTRVGIKPADVTKVFLTHLHSDHVISLPELIVSRHDRGAQARRNAVTPQRAPCLRRDALHQRQQCVGLLQRSPEAWCVPERRRTVIRQCQRAAHRHPVIRENERVDSVPDSNVEIGMSRIASDPRHTLLYVKRVAFKALCEVAVSEQQCSRESMRRVPVLRDPNNIVQITGGKYAGCPADVDASQVHRDMRCGDGVRPVSAAASDAP